MVKELLNTNRVESSILLESQHFNSECIGEEIKYSIYLPEGYYASDSRFPVVYLMHASMGDETSWVQYGQIKKKVDNLCSDGTISQMIIVLLSGVTKKTIGYGSFFINDYKGEVLYEKMFMEELIPHIDESYRTRNNKIFRAVAGCATGGYAALYYADKYPETFSCCMTMSAALIDDETIKNMPDEFYEKNFGRLIGSGLKGEDRINKNFYKLDLLSRINSESYKNTKLYVTCGDKDYKGQVTVTNAKLHIALNKNDIKHDFRMRDGGHTWSYWRDNLPESLMIASAHFLKS